MKTTKFTLGFEFQFQDDSPYEMEVTRENPSRKQIEEIRDWVMKSINEVLEEG